MSPKARRNPVLRAGFVSLGAAVAILAAKVVAYLYTGSMALLADAAESSVNVIAAGVMTLSVAVARRPPDADHPYGHGKAEPLSAAVEGALVFGAALFIAIEAARRIFVGVELAHTTEGMLISGAAGLANLGLGAFLLVTAKRERSEALRADGLHVLSDTITTAASIAALIAVRISGVTVIDPIVALVVAGNLLWAGASIVRRSLTGLLDEADFALLARLADAIEKGRQPSWCDVHQLRTRSVGNLQHIDVHLVVPRALSIEDAHGVGAQLERALEAACPGGADVVVHLDPCPSARCPAHAAEPFSVERVTRVLT